jgi:membrane-associated phospholipid phosphatase
VRPRLLVVSFLLAGLAALALVTVDRPLAHALAGRGAELEPVWSAGITGLEYLTLMFLGRYQFVAAILVATALLAIPAKTRPWAWKVFYLGAVLLVVRLTTNEWKELFGSLRPREWLEKGGDVYFRGGHAFPSGHGSYFGAFTAALFLAWPRKILLVIPLFVACARIGVNDHFVSDILGGFAWGAFVAALLAYAIPPATSSTR